MFVIQDNFSKRYIYSETGSGLQLSDAKVFENIKKAQDFVIAGKLPTEIAKVRFNSEGYNKSIDLKFIAGAQEWVINVNDEDRKGSYPTKEAAFNALSAINFSKEMQDSKPLVTKIRSVTKTKDSPREGYEDYIDAVC